MLTANLDDIRCVPASRTLSMEGMDRPSLESCDGVFDKAALVQRVGMDEDLDIHVVGDGEATIDRSRGGTPVLVKLQPTRACLDLFHQTGRQACVALAENTEIHWKGVGCLEHSLNMPGPGRAGRRSRSGRWSRPAAHHGGKPGIKRFVDLLRADVVHMGVDTAGRDDLA